jgi:hypothetical protein
MKDFIIKVENDNVGMAVGLLFDNYRDNFATFINNVVKGETGSADAFVTKNADGIWEVYQTAPDKGFVLAKVGEGVQVSEYKTLGVDAKYVTYDGDKLALFVKTEAGVPDIKVGKFLNLNEVIVQFDSESVNLAIDTIKAGIKNAAIDQKKIQKKIEKLKKQGKV